MTDRLYFHDAYLTQFDAAVQETRQKDGALWVRLDRTAFYPTGGGQPHDEGTLAAGGTTARVTDVLLEGDAVWHRVDAPLSAGDQVHGRIDWARRFDHMQQHGGEHIMAGTIKQLFDGFTHGLHIGREHSTIDVTMPDARTRLSAEEIAQLEDVVNQRIQQNAPIKAWFPTEEEMANLPMRKDPTVSEHVRVIGVGDYEFCACGGTHPSAAGQIGLLKVLDTQPARGKMRVSFLCGMRAVRHYQAVYDAASQAGKLLSAPPEQLYQEVQRQQDELLMQREQLRALRLQAAQDTAQRLVENAKPLETGGRLAVGHCPSLDADTLKEAAGHIIKDEQSVALLSAPRQQGVVVLFCRGAKAPGDMAALLRQAGARGGGKPDWAQGSADDDSVLTRAAELLMDQQNKE